MIPVWHGLLIVSSMWACASAMRKPDIKWEGDSILVESMVSGRSDQSGRYARSAQDGGKWFTLRLQFFAVLQEMLLLGAVDPIVVSDAIGERVEFRCHVFDVLFLPLGDLPEREHPHAIEDALHHRADPVDLFEIVFLGRVTFSCAPFCGGATG